jgi:hypothetical protein
MKKRFLLIYYITAGLTLIPYYRYLVNKPKAQRSLAKELIGATLGSIFAGFGAIFLIMWTGIFL